MKTVDRALRPARAELRDRRRGRLDPDRRGAHAAHHLRPGRAVGRPLPEGRRDHPGAAQGHRLHRRREGALGDADRRRHRADRAAAGRRQPLRPGEPRVAAPREPGAARAHALQARRQLPGRGRQGHHRRRVHRPHDAGPALVRRPAPGDRGQGRRRGPGREPDARHHHLPELLPHLQEAGGHDRHRRHRGGGVPQDLQARRHRRPDQQADGPQGRRRRRLQERARQVPRGRRRDRRLPRARAAGAGRHGQRREVRGRRVAAAQEEHPAQRAERQAAREARPTSSPRRAARARSPSRPTWPAAAPTSSSAATPSSWRAPRSIRRTRASPGTSWPPEQEAAFKAAFARFKAQCDAEKQEVLAGRAACTSSAPSATSRAASTTSCAAAPAARAIRAARASSCRSKTT